MNNEIKQNLLKVAYNLLSLNGLSFDNLDQTLNAAQTIVGSVVDMEMPDESNDVKPFYDGETRANYLHSIIDGKNVKISSLEETIKDKQKNIEYFNQLIDDKNSEIDYLKKQLKETVKRNVDLKSVLENNNIRLIKAIRRTFENEKYNDAVVRDAKSGFNNHISNLKQSKDLFEEILKNVIE